MPRTRLLLIALIAALLLSPHTDAADTETDADAAAAQHSEIGIANTTADDHPLPDAGRWFPQAGLGLFVHYGIASVGGHQDLSWAMLKDCPWNKLNSGVMTPSAYFAMAERFKAENFNPNRWLKAAKDAGFGYAVLTTRHHDGFALWPSAHGDFNTRNHMDGRDLVKEYVDACRRNGLKVGFYYSPPDWYRERHYRTWGYGTKGTSESPHLDMNHQPVAALPPKPDDFNQKMVDYLNGQLRELLTNYGPIDYLWFDGSTRGVMTVDEIRKLQPKILINDRQHGDAGDIITRLYEGKLPNARPGRLWEHCFSMVGAWGYTKPVRIRPVNMLTSRLASVRCWGGNVLANFGPQPDGDMPPEYYTFMSQMQAWMQWAKPAVVGVEAGPYPSQCSVPVTIHGETWYAFVLPDMKDTRITLTGVRMPKQVTVLRTARELTPRMHDDHVIIDVPDEARERDTVEVLAIEW
ncbi:MAG: alpha-L-fucosidase [Phycisphaerae bacterium]|nr:alpha-L-fucosidase [Phycisphaerae bacterium]